jgi:predicted PurR-regulated permease PerM
MITNEAILLYSNTANNFDYSIIDNSNCSNSSTITCNILNYFDEKVDPIFTNHITEGIATIAQSTIKFTANFIASIPNLVIQAIVIIFTMYILFIKGEDFKRFLNDIIPLKENQKTKIYSNFKNIVNGVIYGQLLTSFIQGIVASIGFYIFGIKSPIIWGLITAIFSLIPFLGAASIWAPLAGIKLIISLINSNITGIWQSVGLIIYGMLIISLIDNFIKPKFIGDKAKLNSILTLVSILGGIKLFGIAGLFLGPIIIALFLGIIDLYIHEIKNKKIELKIRE